jgi:phosphohistidine swiveling domain-containing protein
LGAGGGSVDLSCRDLGLSYPVEEEAPSHLQTVFGRLYSDPRTARRNAVTLTKAATVRLSKGADAVEQRFRGEFLPEFDAEMNVLEIANFERMEMAELFALIERLREDFVTSTHVEVEIVNIAADFHLARAKEAITGEGLDPAAVLGSSEAAVPSRALSEALALPSRERKQHLVDRLGHRSAFDYELSEPRYSETPDHFDAFCHLQKHGAREAVIESPKMTADVIAMVERARRYQTLKEDAKHESLRQLAVLRHALMELDRRLNLSGLVFYLTFDELQDLRIHGTARFRPLAAGRQEKRRELLAMPALPTRLTLAELEAVSLTNASQAGGDISDLKGTRVSGSSTASGRCCIVSEEIAETGRPIENFLDGDIIVCSMVHPAWLPFVLRSSGVVSEVGGWLSHMAIVAREHDIPMIVGARGLGAIPDQSRLTLHPDGGVEVSALADKDGGSELMTS